MPADDLHTDRFGRRCSLLHHLFDLRLGGPKRKHDRQHNADGAQSVAGDIIAGYMDGEPSDIRYAGRDGIGRHDAFILAEVYHSTVFSNAGPHHDLRPHRLDFIKDQFLQ